MVCDHTPKLNDCMLNCTAWCTTKWARSFVYNDLYHELCLLCTHTPIFIELRWKNSKWQTEKGYKQSTTKPLLLFRTPKRNKSESVPRFFFKFIQIPTTSERWRNIIYRREKIKSKKYGNNSIIITWNGCTNSRITYAQWYRWRFGQHSYYKCYTKRDHQTEFHESVKKFTEQL